MSSLSLGFEVLYAGRLIVPYLVTSELPGYKPFVKVTAWEKSPCRACAVDEYCVTDGVQFVDTTEAHTFRWPLTP